MTSLIGAPRALDADQGSMERSVVIFAPTAVEALNWGDRPPRPRFVPPARRQILDVISPRSLVTAIAFAMLVFSLGRLVIHEPINVVSPAERRIAIETSRARSPRAIARSPETRPVSPQPSGQPSDAEPAGRAPTVSAPAVTPPTTPAAPAPERPHPVLSGPHGADISWPQCRAAVPPPQNFAIVGVTNGKPMSTNPCLARQWSWAMSQGAASVYVNVAYPSVGTVPVAACDPTCAHQFGVDTMSHAMQYAKSQGVDSPMIWLDVENGNTWSANQGLNAAVIQGAIDAAGQANVLVGAYSTPAMWRAIAGVYTPGIPAWYAIGPSDGGNAPFKCGPGFTGGRVWLVQYVLQDLDHNIACADVVPYSDRAFRMRGPDN